MRKLLKEEMMVVSGGGDASSMVCAPTLTNTTKGPNGAATSTSTQVCLITGTNSTITNTTNIVTVEVGIGATSIGKLLGFKAETQVQSTSSTQTVCKDGVCSVYKTSDLSDGAAAQDLAFDQLGDDLGNFDAFAGGGGDGDVGCVQIASFLPGGAVAGDMRVGSQMQLSDQVSLEAGTGVVSFSKRKKAQGYRVMTASGVSLICSNTAPIPTPDGIVLAPDLAGKKVAVRRDEGGVTQSGWETVKHVEPVGEIEVQHITVGDKCFWAGERVGSYVLHHNSKAVGGGSDEYVAEIDWENVA